MTKWISIKDKLPNVGEHVLAFGLEDENVHDDGPSFKIVFYDGKNFVSDHFCEQSYRHVTHWTALPNRPIIDNGIATIIDLMTKSIESIENLCESMQKLYLNDKKE